MTAISEYFINGNYKCIVFRNQECTNNGNKGAHFYSFRSMKDFIG